MSLDIIKNKKIFFGISLLIILIGLLSVVFSGFNLGIDFTGGTLMQIELNAKKSVDEIRQITDTFDKNAGIVHAGTDKTQIIIKTTVDLNNEERLEIFKLFADKYGLEDSMLINQQKFGPSIGKEIQEKAIISILVATVFMLIYITYRFEFVFGTAAIAALIHDVLIVLSVYAVLRIPLNSSFFAAMLTIVGYSINDTIVVFDRIRENLKKLKRQDYSKLINTSIRQTLSRSINTSVTTLITISALYILGVEAIKDFALPLVVGIIAGTYSSIFIASPVWYIIKTRKK